MPNTPTEDIQVENETVEPYRGVMIFRTLQRGIIVADGEQSKRSFPAQTFYASLNDKQLPKGYDGEKLFVAMDVEGVRGLLDQAVPGSGLIVARQEEDKKAAGK